MPICTGCKEDKTEDQFGIKYKETGKRITRCRECVRQSTRRYYRENKELCSAKYKTDRLKINGLNQGKLFSYFKEHPCIDCGESDILVLQFDHRDPTEKELPIAKLLNKRVRWERIQMEIDKCDVRCANCHTRKHAIENRNWRYKLLQAE